MANLHITELSGLPAGDNNTDLLAVVPDAIQATQSIASAVAPGTTSVAFQSATKWLKLKAGGPLAYAIGSTPQAAVGGNFLNAGDTEYVRIVPGKGLKINVVTDTP